MKRFHVNVAVAELVPSVEFYSILFGEAPTVLKEDYAKWMLDDPRINFSLSVSAQRRGVNHIGLQTESLKELATIQKRLRRAGQDTFDQPDAECCYAKSSKTWVRDPDDVAWETFVTHDEISHYGDDNEPGHTSPNSDAARCCSVESESRCCV